MSIDLFTLLEYNWVENDCFCFLLEFLLLIKTKKGYLTVWSNGEQIVFTPCLMVVSFPMLGSSSVFFRKQTVCGLEDHLDSFYCWLRETRAPQRAKWAVG